jgi:hypothetical protein
MTEKPDPKDNLSLLLKHLKNDSLAYDLVRAYRDSESGDPVESMRAVLRGQLERIRDRIANPED